MLRFIGRASIVALLILVVIVLVARINQARRAPTAPPSPAVGETPPARIAAGPACQVAGIKELGNSRLEDWSQTNGLILTNPKDGDTYQVHVRQLDGSNDRCLTCVAHPGSPRVDRYKVAPRWDPSGQWIVVVGETDDNQIRRDLTNPVKRALAGRAGEGALLNGWYANVYATTPDGSKWYNLTQYASDQPIFGSLGANFSSDGKKLTWPKLVARPDNAHPFGFWRPQVADFVVDRNGTPSLQNVRNVTPGNGSFYEPFGLTRDGTQILMSSDLTTTDPAMDLYLVNIANGETTNLTNTRNQWNEHGRFSPSGKKIAWMSSIPYAGSGPAAVNSLKTELMLMDANGQNLQQVTHFNAPGYPEYSQERSVAGRSSWSADGSQILVNQLLSGPHYPATNYWLVTFQGTCGG